MTLKDIEAMVASKFENVSQQDLLKAFAVVNIYKKQMGHLESDVKTALEKSFPKVKGGIQDSLSFSTGVAFDVEAGYKEVKDIKIKDIDALEMDLVARSTDVSPSDYIKTTKTITKTNRERLYRAVQHYNPELMHHFEQQECLDFNVKVKEVS